VPEIISFAPGGYRYIKGAFQYSGGVRAEPGFAIERARLSRPVPLKQGFAAVESHFKSIGRPETAFCACELRSPKPFTRQGFVDFNREYVKTLERWGIFKDDVNPVARTNVCPDYGGPAEPSLYAFSYTVPSETQRPSFIIAGSGEAHEVAGKFEIVRAGDTTLDGMREKLRFVMSVMESRLTALGLSWELAVATQAYTVFDIGPFIGKDLAAKGAIPGGLIWHFARPPVVDIDFEMDVHGPIRQIVL
jgi:hypothetical protein